MIEKIVKKLINKMVEEKMIEEKWDVQYIYASITMLERFIVIGTIVIISAVFKVFMPTLFFLITFLSLRKRTGGYHANSFLGCYIGTTITYIIILGINNILANYPKLLLGLLLLALGIIEVMGIINHPNMHMNSEELVRAKRMARISALYVGSFIYLMVLINIDWIFVSYMATAVILCATLLCIAKILKQEV